jgi:UPF0755 protein
MGEPDPEHPEHDFIQAEEPRRGRRSSRRRRRRGCLPVLLVLVVVAGGLAFGGKIAYDEISARLAPAPDYAGPGTGEVLYEVKDGATSAQIGRDLKEAGVVKSVDAFTAAARENQESRNIQVGFYTLQEQMKAAEALEVLVDPANRVRNQVTVPEGLRAVDVAKLLGEKTDFPRAQFTRELENPTALGLPDYAEGNPEGYLFPATYEIGPKDNPRTILRAMVDRWRQAAEDADLEARAEQLGFTPAELMTIASLVEAEGRGDDMAKISRVLYNRLETKGPPTFGKLEVDATVNYALGRNLGVAISPEDLDVDSPYNTRKNPGLPPGPIEAPGEEAIRAALEPAEGDWLFYVTVNLRTGETKFAKDYDEFLRYKKEYQQYCETSDAC